MRGFAAHDQGPSLFDVLGLLAQPVDHQLEVEADRSQCRIEGLGAERVGFAVEFLGEEVELAPHPAAIAADDQGPGRLDMGIQPVEFLAHIEAGDMRSEEHTSELQSLMRISYAVFCLKKKN